MRRNAMSRAMTGAEMVLQVLADQGVDHIFGYPGGAVLPIYDELFKQDRLKHILVRHEQGAVHAAEGYARSTGKVGCVLVTSGPGATNAVTGLTDALMDSIPIVCITGQVPTHLIGNDAFQECDTVGITRPCTKHNYLVKDVNNLSRVLHEAFYVARTGRPGPVVVDIPKDIQFAKGLYTGLTNSQHKSYRPQIRRRRARGCGRRRPHRQCQAPDLLHRRRHHQFRAGGEQAIARIRAHDRLSHHLDPDGARRLPRLRQAMARHARHAWHLRGQQRHARLRRDDLHRRPLRRPHHRQGRRLLARIQEDPRRYRPLLDQQERACRPAHRRRLRARARADDRRVECQEAEDRQGGAESVVGRDRPLARAEMPALSQARRRDHAAIRHRAALRADPRPRHLHHHRGRPAPDVGGAVLQIRRAQPLDDVGRSRHHGLWPAVCRRRAGRASRIRSSSTLPAKPRC